MPHYIIIGLGSGLTAALLYGTVVTMTPLGMLLFYLAPLPLMISGLGWGWIAAIAGGLAGTVAISVIIGLLGGLVFLATVAAPAVLLSYTALLSRQVAGANPDPDGRIPREWYPEGRLVMWTAGMAVLFSISVILATAPGAEAFYDVVREQMRRMIDANGLEPVMPGLTGEERDAIIDAIAHILPSALASIWFATTLTNFAIAAKILSATGRSLRPWASFGSLRYPPIAIYVLGAATILAMLASGLVALFSTILAGVMLLAYAIMGLAVFHDMAGRTQIRIPLLLGVYLMLLIFNWIAVVALAALALSDMVFGFRDRNRTMGPPNSGGG